MSRDYVTKILKARVYDVARETPLELAPKLSARLGSEVWLKREDLQPVFSFKLRGAYNKLASLSPEERAQGVIASSAGNHAQGVALAARRLGARALIVMPETAPRIKVDAVERLGAEVLLAGDSYDGAKEKAEALAAERGMILVPPYDDEHVIAGQGTVGMEIVRQQGEAFDAIFVSVGGGGLIAGIAAYIKALWPETRIIGVEPEDTPTLHAALAAGERVVLDQVGTFADGVAVKQIGAEPFRIARECIDEVVLVSTDEICAAIKDIFEDTRSIAEPAGALAVAGLKRYVEREDTRGGRFAAVVSGANVNFDRLRHIAQRAQLGEQREILLAVTIPERPGSLLRFCELIGTRSITEFNYRYADDAAAHIFVGVEISGAGADRAVARGCAGAGRLPRARSHRQRDGEAPRPLHGGRPRAGGLGRGPLPLRLPRAAGGAHALPHPDGPQALEHQHVPLPQPRLGLRPRADRPAGAEGRARRLPDVPRAGGLRLPRRDRQPRLPPVPAVEGIRERVRPWRTRDRPRPRPAANAARPRRRRSKTGCRER